MITAADGRNLSLHSLIIIPFPQAESFKLKSNPEAAAEVKCVSCWHSRRLFDVHVVQLKIDFFLKFGTTANSTLRVRELPTS